MIYNHHNGVQVGGEEQPNDDLDLGENGLMIRSPGEFIPEDPDLLQRDLGLLSLDKEAETSHQALSELAERTGMPITQENGQRCYGPPLDPSIPVPVRGSEVFVGKLPRNCYEPDIVPVFEKAGRIYELRLMMDFSGTNRGYCFVLYFTPEEAEKATRELNGYEMIPGKRIGVVKSVDNCRIILHGIPTDRDEGEIREEMEKLTDGVVKVTVHDPQDFTLQAKNRGYAFVEYESHKAAAMAKRKLVPGNIKLWDEEVIVDWAVAELGVSNINIFKQTHTLLIKHLSPVTSVATLQRVIESVSKKDVLHIRKRENCAFVDFRTHSEAEEAMVTLGNVEIDDHLLRVCWARDRDGGQRKGNKVRIEFKKKNPPRAEHWQDNRRQEMNGERSRNGVAAYREQHHSNDFHSQPEVWNNHANTELGGFKNNAFERKACNDAGRDFIDYPHHYQAPGEYANNMYLYQTQQPQGNRNFRAPAAPPSSQCYCMGTNGYSPFFQYDCTNPSTNNYVYGNPTPPQGYPYDYNRPGPAVSAWQY
ncbi:RNA-binding protein 47 [Orchesella cincta]|uniref:RNA-binding protein 47 n=1 Tax=Orchesella cincta TaxID=48709 RepID=A0A1D2NEV4_ORCCI|nr:RNA-binding protein 47 [Orchesella cincta]